METIDLNLLKAFTAVHDAGSFSEAADRLGVPRSTVSRAVSALEGALKVRLFHRTTRKVSTTTAGVALYDRVAPSLQALEASLQELPEREETPSGTLRVTSAVDVGSVVLAEAAARFTQRYPNVQVDVTLSNQVMDLVRLGFDLAVRVSSRPLRDSTLVATRAGALTSELFAAPEYLARKGSPRSLDEACGHDWVTFRGAKGEHYFASKTRPPHSTSPRIVCDDMFFAREAVKAGAGLGVLPSFIADADVEAGRLVRLLPVAQAATVYIVHPSRKHLPRKVSAFRDLLLEMLRRKPLGRTAA
jgi:DNA-binding transcriptional LysR family regulator